MYESQFQLKRRPFAATPDPKCFLALGPIQGALDELVVCVEQGQGVAVVSAPAGTGKTLLCERLRTELEDRFETIFLRHASFLTRRALLQTILAELNHSYRRHDEQELRLELIPAIQALSPNREALVLLCDEAHMLTEDLLEELRMLSDLAEHGRPLVRLVLVGQPALEETLAQPGLEALNQRIRAHVCLETFDRRMSHEYIDYRITWAGGRTPEVFTSDATELIVRACEGVPRCINQLCDHALLLAYVAEQIPVTSATIREALQDLRQLPLHWNETLLAGASEDSSDVIVTVSSPAFEAARESTHFLERSPASEMESVEFGADLPSNEVEVEVASGEFEPSHQDACDDADMAFEDALVNDESVADASQDFTETGAVAAHESLAAEPTSEIIHKPQPITVKSLEENVAEPAGSLHSNEVVEEMVCDRYAAIDGGFPIPQRVTVVIPPEESVVLETSEWADILIPDSPMPETAVTDEMEAVEPETELEASAMETASEVSAELADTPASAETMELATESVSETAEFASVCTRLDDCLPKVDESPAWDSAALEFGATEKSATPEFAATTESDDWDSIEAELGAAVCEIAKEIRSEIPDAGGSSTLHCLQEFLAPEGHAEVISVEIGVDSNSYHSPQENTGGLERRIDASASGRPFRNLFTQLRRKQQGLL